MAIHIRRREVIVGLGGTAAAWPIGSIAQQPTKKIRSLGLLLPGLPEASMGKATRNRLRELGYAEGRDILLQARWANGNMERLDDPVGSGIVPSLQHVPTGVNRDSQRTPKERV